MPTANMLIYLRPAPNDENNENAKYCNKCGEKLVFETYNKERDNKVHLELKKSRWNIITVWTCQLKPQNRTNTLESIVLLLEKIFLESQKKQKCHPYIFHSENHRVAEREEGYNSESFSEKE